MINGILLINKPIHYTSHDVVAICRKYYNQKRIGHTGTLDPEATGLLPICLGKATRLVEYIQSAYKVYEVEMVLGYATDTYDSTGKRTCESDLTVTETQIAEVISSFTGTIDQIPPMYSAIKNQGKKLYELAREGIVIERKPRRVEIKSISDIQIRENKLVSFTVNCSSGTYVRSLCHDIGIKLGTYGTMTNLKRTRVGEFDLSQTIDLKTIKDKKFSDDKKTFHMPMENAVKHLPKLSFNESKKKAIINGQRIYNIRENMAKVDYAVFIEKEFIGIGRVFEDNGSSFFRITKCLV